MSPRGTKQKITTHKVEPGRVSPDDVKFRMLEAERQRAMDTRSDLEKVFGDPAPHRSALAQRRTTGSVVNPYARIRAFD